MEASEAFHTAWKLRQRNRRIVTTDPRPPSIDFSCKHLFFSFVYRTEGHRGGPASIKAPHLFLLLQMEEDGIKETWEEGCCWCLVHHVGPPEECCLPSAHLLHSMSTLGAGCRRERAVSPPLLSLTSYRGMTNFLSRTFITLLENSYYCHIGSCSFPPPQPSRLTSNITCTHVCTVCSLKANKKA